MYEDFFVCDDEGVGLEFVVCSVASVCLTRIVKLMMLSSLKLTIINGIDMITKIDGLTYLPTHGKLYDDQVDHQTSNFF